MFCKNRRDLSVYKGPLLWLISKSRVTCNFFTITPPPRHWSFLSHTGHCFKNFWPGLLLNLGSPAPRLVQSRGWLSIRVVFVRSSLGLSQTVWKRARPNGRFLLWPSCELLFRVKETRPGRLTGLSHERYDLQLFRSQMTFPHLGVSPSIFARHGQSLTQEWVVNQKRVNTFVIWDQESIFQ